MSTPTRMSDIVLAEIHSHFSEKPLLLNGDTITSLQLTSSVAPQHGSASISFKQPANAFSTVYAAWPGDWLIIRDFWGKACFFGRVTTVDDSISTGGGVNTSSLTISAVSWIDSLDLSEVFAPDGALDKTIGTLFTKQDWARTTTSFFQNYVFGQVGEALQILWRNLARIQLPSTLGGGFLGDLVPVVYDEETRNAWAPDMVVEPLPQAGALPTQLNFLAVKSRVYDLLRGLFVPEPALIELFPHFSPALADFTEQQRAARPLKTVPVTPKLLKLSEDGQRATQGGLEYPSEEQIQRDMLQLEEKLGVKPVLIYRIRPWRSRPLIESVYAEPEAENAPEKELKSSKAQAKNILKDSFNMVTWDRKYFTKIPYDLVTSISRTKNLSDQITCTTINLVVSQLDAISAAGLPVKNSWSIENEGLRTIQATWPFIIRPKEDAKLASFLAYMRTIAAQIMSFYAMGHRFGTGSVECASASRTGSGYTVEAVAGKPFAITTSSLKNFVDDVKQLEFVGYCESLTRSASVVGSSVIGRSSISFSRGLYGYEEEDVRESFVAVSNTTLPTSNPTPNAGNSPGARSQAEKIDDPVGGCTKGRPAPVWPNQLTLSSIDVPTWLRPWILGRIKRSDELARVTQYWDTLPSEFNYVVEVPVGKKDGTQEIIYESTTKYTLYHNTVILSACAYVIFKYWRLKDPGCDISIHSWAFARDGSTHPFAAAIDFTIELSTGGRVPALQAWYALSLLGRAKRIPLGGRGLYLNVNPISGIQGTEAEKAGSASSSISGPGGSSATHYDARGSFGITGANKTYAPHIWAGLDWTGNGKDELTTSSNTPIADVFALVTDPEGRLSKYKQNYDLVNKMFFVEDPKNQAGIRANWNEKSEARKVLREDLILYFNNKVTNNIKNAPEPKQDTYLPEVTNEVPNVLQVLGIEGWCKAGDSSQVQTQTEASYQQQIVFDPSIGFFIPASSENAPIVLAFSGDSVNSQAVQGWEYFLGSTGTLSEKQKNIVEDAIAKSEKADPACQVMLSALSPLISKCHIFISSNKDVDGKKVYPFVKESAKLNNISVTTLDHTFFAFSSGWKTAKQAYSADLSSVCKYAYIVDFEAKQQAATLFALSLSRSFRAASQVYYTSTQYGFGGAGGIFLAGMQEEFKESDLVYQVTPPAPAFSGQAELDLHFKALQVAAGYLKNRIEGYTPSSSKKTSLNGEYGKLFIASPTSPLILVYGGTEVRKRQSGEYMLDYFMGLTSKNNVFIAKDNRVSGPDSAAWAMGGATTPGSQPAWRKKIIVIFSGGQLPAKSVLAQSSDLEKFDKIYLVDPYLLNTFNHWHGLIQTNPSKFVFVYTDVPLNKTINDENGATKEKLKSIKDAVKPSGVIKLVDAVHTTLQTGPDGPVWVPDRTATKDELLDAHMKTNSVAVAHMLQIQDADK